MVTAPKGPDFISAVDQMKWRPNKPCEALRGLARLFEALQERINNDEANIGPTFTCDARIKGRLKKMAEDKHTYVCVRGCVRGWVWACVGNEMVSS